MSDNSYETNGQWITDAPANYTVNDAEYDEAHGIAWPISGDETTICNNPVTEGEDK